MRRTRNARRAAASVLAVPLALSVLAGCGSDDGEDQGGSRASDPAASASPEAGESDSAAPETEPAEAGGDQEPGTEISTDEFAALLQSSLSGSAHVTMRNEGGMLESTSEGDIDFSSDPPSLDMTMSAPDMGGEMHLVLVDNVMYMRMGELSNGKYISYDLDDPDNPMGEEMTAQLDPRTSLDTMKQAITEVVYVGATSLDGDEVDQYRAVLDPNRMFAADDEIPADALPKQVTYEVWVDDEGRIRQVVTEAGKQLGSSTITYSDWGKQVTVEAPPADQVEEMPRP